MLWANRQKYVQASTRMQTHVVDKFSQREIMQKDVLAGEGLSLGPNGTRFNYWKVLRD